jgi:small-conductance mechanosensitive channel
MYKLERKKHKKRKHKMRGQITLDIREGVGVFVLLIIAAAVIAITGGVSTYILNSLGPMTNKTVVGYGNQAIASTSSTFVTVVSLIGGLVLGMIAFGFLRRIWKEFTS